MEKIFCKRIVRRNRILNNNQNNLRRNANNEAKINLIKLMKKQKKKIVPFNSSCLTSNNKSFFWNTSNNSTRWIAKFIRKKWNSQRNLMIKNLLLITVSRGGRSRKNLEKKIKRRKNTCMRDLRNISKNMS
jgi:hypothetical protein